MRRLRVRFSRRRLAALAALLSASAFGVSLLAFRYLWSGGGQYRNLLWNLVLAWVPFLLALVVYDRARRGTSRSVLVGLAVLWLAFLPNAPYLVTELQFLRWISDMPLWFDVALLTTFAWTGLILGFASVYLVQQSAARLYGRVVGWTVALTALALSGLGVYLGRELRWNSWDILVRPGGIAGDVLDQLASPRLVGMTLVLGSFLTVAYAMLYTVLQAAFDERDRAE
jgi:uncharacterized membrane protein